jgi:quercetin dioxygenase-like cupin family protein
MTAAPQHFQVHFDEIAPVLFEPLPGHEGEPDVRFLIADVPAEVPLCLFRCVFPPRALHGRHYHPNADEFIYIVRGEAAVGTGEEEHPATAGTAVYSRRGDVHWLRNVSESQELELIGGFAGAADLDAAGYVFVDDIDEELRRVPFSP